MELVFTGPARVQFEAKGDTYEHRHSSEKEKISHHN